MHNRNEIEEEFDLIKKIVDLPLWKNKTTSGFGVPKTIKDIKNAYENFYKMNKNPDLHDKEEFLTFLKEGATKALEEDLKPKELSAESRGLRSALKELFKEKERDPVVFKFYEDLKNSSNLPLSQRYVSLRNEVEINEIYKNAMSLTNKK